MTLSKLSLRNAKRQGRDYLVYFVTMILSAALIYSFNALVVSDEIRNLSSMLENMPLVITLSSIVVVFIIGWLVHYTMRFMLAKRSKELGTYILMGIENRQITRLFLLENISIGGVSLVIGVLSGNLIFQAMRAVLLNMYGIHYYFKFTFSFKAVALTILYFTLIYLFSLGKSRKRIKNSNIYALLNSERQNEEGVIKKEKTRRMIFVASIFCGIVGTLMLMLRSIAFGILGSVFLIIFLYGFFVSFSTGIPAYFDKHPEKKYSKTNLIVFRSLASKLNSMGVTMATISLLITVILIAAGTGVMFTNQFSRTEELYTCFDLFISSFEEGADFAEYEAYINEYIPVRQDYTYEIYSTDNSRMTEYIESNYANYFYFYENDMMMRMSDYIELRSMLGYPDVEGKQEGYMIHCTEYLEKLMNEFEEPLLIGDTILPKSNVYSEDFTQYLWSGNGSGFIFVVPDDVIETHEAVARIYVAMTDTPITYEAYGELWDIRDQKAMGKDFSLFDTIKSQGATREENASGYIMIVFPLFYLALVLMLATVTILTMQLLGDAPKYRRQFALLHKLGTSQRDMVQAVRRKFALFYMMPAVPPLMISTSFLFTFGNLYDLGIIKSTWHLWSLIGRAFALFFLIYMLYVIVAYTSFKRNVLLE